MPLSKMMIHYMQVKEQYPDCLVFYRLGDFYEMFFDDAKTASEALDLTLTGRDCGLKERAPMCGVPYHAVDQYIGKLVEAGYKVAICEQLTEPGGKDLVERGVVRIVTSGTLTDDSQIDEKANNYICAVYYTDKGAGVAWADITTGDFLTSSVSSDDGLFNLLTRINAAENIVNEKGFSVIAESPLVVHKVLPKPHMYKEAAFEAGRAKEAVTDQLNIHDLSAVGLENDSLAAVAAGALLQYLKETQMHALKNISRILPETDKTHMVLDETCMRDLEILKSMHTGKTYGSLLYVMDQTLTAMGARLLRNILSSPLTDKDRINDRLDGVEELYKNLVVTNSVREILPGVKDIERIAGKISNGNVTPRDLETLRYSLEVLPQIKFRIAGLSSKELKRIDALIPDLSGITSLLKSVIKDNPPALCRDGGFIRSGFDEELDKFEELKTHGNRYMDEILLRERESTGIKNMRIGYNKVFGYYLEVSNSFKNRVPSSYIRRQTLTGGERYITEELKDLEEKILSSSESALKKELEIFEKLKETLSLNLDGFKKAAKAIAALDVLCAFSYLARKNNYCRPEIAEKGGKLSVTAGRHPVIETIGGQFVANDTDMDNGENSMLIITGPNMAGKSTYLRQVALITVMAHCGSFVPAKSAVIPITDRVFTRVGASDNLLFDRSTFMVEMNEVAMILRLATKDSLLVLDEVGRGTSTYDGLGIAWAVVEYICTKLRSRTLFATHYHELSELEGVIPGVKNYKITVREANGQIIFLRKVMRGSANKSFGIEVASLAGVPQKVTDRAKVILRNLEKADTARKRPAEGGLIGEENGEAGYSEVENIIKDTDTDKLTPLQALFLLTDLKEKLLKK